MICLTLLIWLEAPEGVYVDGDDGDGDGSDDGDGGDGVDDDGDAVSVCGGV